CMNTRIFHVLAAQVVVGCAASDEPNVSAAGAVSGSSGAGGSPSATASSGSEGSSGSVGGTGTGGTGGAEPVRSRIGVFRPTGASWMLDDGDGSFEGCAVDTCLQTFGGSTNIPVVGQW